MLERVSQVSAKWDGSLLFGTAYYPEYMPQPRVEVDLSGMRAAGMSVIRVGESTWSDWEPEEGRFQSEWMREVLNRAEDFGLKVILGVPTYSIPPWLYRKHPDIVVTRQGPGRAPIGPDRMPTYPALVPPGGYGPRQNQDYAHPEFRRYAARIAGWVVEALGDHPTVIGYQIDNETMPTGWPTPYTRKGFADYLRKKYGTVDELNRRLVLSFWGQKVVTWEDLPPPDGLINPGLCLEWERYQREVVREYLRMLAGVVRERARPGQFITHDFIGGLHHAIDPWAISRDLDVAAANVYYPTQERMNARAIWFAADAARSFKRDRFLVTETNAQAIGWDARAQFPPYPGQLKLAALALVAGGAEMVAYWHWATVHNGQETYWRGVLGHDLEPNRVYAEVTETGALLGRLGEKLRGQHTRARVAILCSPDSWSALKRMPFSDHYGYEHALGRLYDGVHGLGLAVDFISPETEDWSGYAVVLVPPLYVASDGLLTALADYVAGGGHALVMFKSGFANEDCTVRALRAPGPLRQAAGVSYQEFSSLAAPVPLLAGEGSCLRVGFAEVWVEFLQLEGAECLAQLDHPVFRYPVVARNRHGQGELTYQGAALEPESQGRLVAEVLRRAGVQPPAHDLPVEVAYREAKLPDGRGVHYFLNFSGHVQLVGYAGGDGVELIGGSWVRRGERVEVRGWSGVVVLEGLAE